MEDEYKKGYERARREIARRSVSVWDPLTFILYVSLSNTQKRENHMIKPVLDF